MNETKQRLVVKSALRVVELHLLQADPSYQRDLKRGHAQIVSHFDEDALGVLTVGEREDGSLWLVDGFQRSTALKKLGWTKARAQIFNSMGPEHEAAVFKLINMGRTRLTPGEEFKALLTAHDETAWEIKRCVEECGLKLVYKKHPGQKVGNIEVNCFSTLRRAHKQQGIDALRFALSVAKEAWPDDRKAFHHAMVGGLAIWFVRYKGLADNDRLMPRLQSVTAHAILYTASQATLSNNQCVAVADQVERVYRKRLKIS